MARRNRKSKTKKRRDRRKAIFVLPNLLTSASLFTGFFSIVSSMEGSFVYASLAIVGSAVLDFLDGKVARLTNTTSRFGVEYDSLCDLVAFGVAPAILAFEWALEPVGRLGWAAAFLFVACGALRLARFNVQVDKGNKHFVGLPIPAAACMLATTVLLLDQLGIKGPVDFWPVVVLVLALSFLMVSNVHYLSFKDVGLSRLRSFNWLVAAILVFVLVAVQPQVMGFLFMATYVLGGPLAAHVVSKRREAEDKTAETEDSATQKKEITSA